MKNKIKTKEIPELETVIESVGDGITLSDTSGHFEIFNSKMQEISGYTIDEANACGDFSSRIYPDCQERRKALEDLKEVMQKGRYHEVETTIQAKDGSKKTLLVSTTLIGYKDRDMFLSIYRDITERKRTEEELKKSKEKLELQAWGLQKTNEAIKLLYKELEAMHKKLQEIDLMKSDFVSHVSHELRTPLTTMREAIAQLLDGLQGPLNESQRKFLEISQRSIDRLTRIISNLLDLSRLDAGKIKLERRSVDITILAREMMESLRPQAEQKKIKLEDKLPATLPETFVDPDRIRQIFTNLVGNALKYTKEGGTITLSAQQNEDSLEASVTDTGIGIPPEYLDKIFERFERVSKIPIPGVGGAGLGLAICKELLDLHKGRICVESQVGKGSEFTITLPIYKEQDFLKDYLGEQIQVAKRFHSFVSLITIDIENFEQLKKDWGSDIAEGLKKQLEDLITSYTRDPMDKVIRYKESTLALVLIGTAKENGQAVAERLKAQAEKYGFKLKDKTIKLPLKFKEPTYPMDGQTEDELIKAVEG